MKKHKERFTPKALLNYCNKNFQKKTGNSFTSQDIQQYIIRGHLPDYLGGQQIVKVEVEDVSFYELN